ncbi:aromatic ring-hydroxylating oxygenase subunit alpha [Longivirga aurantiaca]|uniref:SRPBCC family protein n=1 Tax=Longivirga aurantiaca TaxID=1837743 RepID=A0ABW1T0M8_9ACTN
MSLDLTDLRPLAPVDPEGLSRALLPFGQSTMLPAEAYTSPHVLAWERRNLVAGSWACVGRVDELRTDADGGRATQRALLVGDVPVLLTFEGDDVHAFANTCRHRGHVLLEDDCTSASRSVLCVYHAWTYRLDGSLQAAPGFRDSETFVGADHGLVPLPSKAWHGWLFVNATGTAPAWEDHLGVLDELVAPYHPESLVLGARHSYEIAANWKLVSENYHECYHCPLIHPELCQVSIPTSGDNFDRPGAWVGGTMEFKGDAVTMSLDGTSKGVPIEGAPQDSVLYVQLFPNLLFSGHPDYVMTHRVLPLGPDRSWIECSWYFPSADVDPSYAVEFWDLTNSQDWRACELVQRGLTSPHFKPGPFAPNEDAVHQWVQMVGRGYLGIAPSDKPGSARTA